MFKAIQFLYKQQVILFLLISSKNALRNQFQSVLIESTRLSFIDCYINGQLKISKSKKGHYIKRYETERNKTS
jgi:hypothetical protein